MRKPWKATSWKARAAVPTLVLLAALLTVGGAQAMRNVAPVNTALPTILTDFAKNQRKP
jgi:hypothetical protein